MIRLDFEYAVMNEHVSFKSAYLWKYLRSLAYKCFMSMCLGTHVYVHMDVYIYMCVCDIPPTGSH